MDSIDNAQYMMESLIIQANSSCMSRELVKSVNKVIADLIRDLNKYHQEVVFLSGGQD